jgi:hypothetical protein
LSYSAYYIQPAVFRDASAARRLLALGFQMMTHMLLKEIFGAQSSMHTTGMLCI